MAARKQPQFIPTEYQRGLIATLVSCGIAVEAACVFIVNEITGKPINPKTARKVFAIEIDNAREIANAKLVNALFQMAVQDKVPAVAIWLGKVRLGWKEPAQDVNLHQSYGELVEAATKPKEPPALTVVQGGKA